MEVDSAKLLNSEWANPINAQFFCDIIPAYPNSRVCKIGCGVQIFKFRKIESN